VHPKAADSAHPPTDPAAAVASARAGTLALPLGLGAAVAIVTYLALAPVPPGRGLTAAPTLAGVTLDPRLAEAKLRAAVSDALVAWLRTPVTLTLGDGASRQKTRAELGFRIDDARLDALLRDARDPDSALVRSIAGRRLGAAALPLPVRLDPRAALTALGGIKDDLDRPAEDAKIDLDGRKVVPEKPGLRIDVYASLEALGRMPAGDPRAATLALVTESVAPTQTAATLGHVALDDVIGFFETKYATDQKHADRSFNLRLAASRLNGKVLMPGETFDFNAVVGPRDEAHGYRVAKVIADGELVDGIGGGTCQIAGTLHGAAFFAGLEIVQRTPHTRPSSYIKMGLDAAVAYPHVTLKLRNPFGFPVVLHETVTNGTVRAEVLGPKRERMVTFIRKIDDVIPFAERVVPDDRLPKGKRVVSQRGIPGFKVRRYRVVRDGAFAVREKTSDSYPPTTQIVHVGTGLAGGSAPPEDEHPEYVADEYLAITQGPGVGKATGESAGMEEVRVAGRTGTHGWTRRWSTARAAAGNAETAGGADDGRDARDGNDDADETKKSSPVRRARRHGH
jgi:vancomycin resistance protein YoaR